MKYTLGPFVFVVPDLFRDETDYIYASRDDAWGLRVSRAPEGTDAAPALESAKKGFEEFYDGSIVYTKPLRLVSAQNTVVPAYEGDLVDPMSSVRRRFALLALPEGRRTVVFVLMGPGASFLAELNRLVRSVHFLSDAPVAAVLPSPRMSRRQAGSVSFEVPADWTFTTTLLFAETTADDVTLRLTLDEPAVPEGAVSFEAEVPAAAGDRVVLVRRDVHAGRPNGLSWAGEFSVDHVSPGGTRRVELRKACVTFVRGKTLTAYGHAPENKASKLTVGWNTLLQTIGQRTP